MKDARILAGRGPWNEIPNRIAEANRKLAKDPRREEVELAIDRVMDAQKSDTNHSAEESLLLKQQLQSIVPIDLQIRDAVQNEGSGVEMFSDTLKYLLGVVLGRVDARRDASRKTLECFWGLRHDALISEAWRNSFFSALRSDGKSRDRWMALGLRLPDWKSEGADSSIVAQRSWDGIRQSMENWRRTTDAFEAWRYQVDIDWHVGRWLEFLWIPLDLDRASWARHVDSLPDPALAGHAVALAGIREDGDLFRELLELAPTAFDVDGQWTRGLLAIELVGSVLEYPLALAWAVDDRIFGNQTDDEEARRKLRQEEIPAWLNETFKVLLARSDGRILAIAYLGRLATELLQDEQPGRLAKKWLLMTAFEVLAKELSQRSDTLREIRQFAESRERTAADLPSQSEDEDDFDVTQGEGGRRRKAATLPFLLSAIQCCVQQYPPAEEERADGNARRPIPVDLTTSLMEWFRHLVVERDLGIDDVVRRGVGAGQLTESLLGYILALSPDARQAWRGLWRETEAQRRRFAYRESERGHEALYSSEVVLRTGLATLQFCSTWAGPGEDRDRLREFFDEVIEAALWLWTLDSERHGDLGTASVLRCFAYAPHVFKDGWDVPLGPLVSVVVPHAGKACKAASNLWRNGAGLEKIEAMFTRQGISLVQAFRDAREWHSITQDIEFDVAGFESLERAVGAMTKN